MERLPRTEHGFTSDGIEHKQENRVLSAQFGDGYAQIAPDGINTDISTFNITWSNILQGEAELLFNFLAPRQGGLDSFYFTPPDTNNEIVVKCVSVSKKTHSVVAGRPDISFFTISAELKRTANLGA